MLAGLNPMAGCTLPRCSPELRLSMAFGVMFGIQVFIAMPKLSIVSGRRQAALGMPMLVPLTTLFMPLDLNRGVCVIPRLDPNSEAEEVAPGL